MERVEKCLDHGFVRLVDSMGSDLAVVRAARVSYAADWRSGADEGSDAKLIKYLLKNNHTSPFEAVVFTFEIKAPIFVFRQWHRHRTWSYNEVSARYTTLPAEVYVPDPKMIGEQSKTNKQGREIGASVDRQDEVDVYRRACENSFLMYEQLLKADWPRELARAVLPVSTYSRMFATVDLHNLFHFLRLRLHAHAQYEIRVYAEAMLELVEAVVPVCVEVFREGRE